MLCRAQYIRVDHVTWIFSTLDILWRLWEPCDNFKNLSLYKPHRLVRPCKRPCQMCPLRQVDRLKSHRLLRHTSRLRTSKKKRCNFANGWSAKPAAGISFVCGGSFTVIFNSLSTRPHTSAAVLKSFSKPIPLRPHHALPEAFTQLLDRVAGREKPNRRAHLGKSSSVASCPRLFRAAIRSRRLAFSSRFSK